jgi:cytochrome c oxidase subunit 2
MKKYRSINPGESVNQGAPPTWVPRQGHPGRGAPASKRRVSVGEAASPQGKYSEWWFGSPVLWVRPFLILAPWLCSFLMMVLLPSVALASPPSPLNPASEGAQAIANLYWFTFWIAAAIFILVEGMLVYAVICFRQRKPEVTPPKIHGSTPLEIAWTVVPAIIVLMVFVLMVRTMGAAAQPPAEAIPVKVIGHQWWWEFQYSDLNITTANELHIPVGEPVIVELISDNVIHSFWIPQLAGKTDVIPGRVNTMWFQADEAGTYRGQCAELCGFQHANMNFLVIAEPAEQFLQWLEQQQTPPAAVTGEAATGQEVFMSGQCIACHTIEGTVAQGIIGPDLTHFGSRQTIAGLVLENTPDNLARWLADPQTIKPLNKMVIADELSQDEIEALVQYLSSLK